MPALTPAGRRAARDLLLIAALLTAIYTGFALLFPLIPLTRLGGPAADLESLLRGRRWGAPLYAAGLIALAVLFWQAMWVIHRLSRREPDDAARLRTPVLAAGLIQALPLIFLYPITALDVFLYAVRARLWALYGASPMLALPADYAFDPAVRFAGEFASEPSPYGPLWELIAVIPARLGAVEMVSGVLAMKILAVLAFAAGAALLGGWVWHASGAPRGLAAPPTALLFFAWNPLVLMQGIGNGHNDLAMLALMILAIGLWWRGRWWLAGLALTGAALVKISALFLLPLLALDILRAAPGWRARLLRGLTLLATFAAAGALLYALTGPLPDALAGLREAAFGRRGFAPASAFRMILREIVPRGWAEPLPRQMARTLFVGYYAYLSWRLWRGRLSLIQAAYLAYFSQLLLGAVFRIWYPLWLVPLAALGLTSRTFWRTLLFGLTAELSLVSYFIVWRWWLVDWGPGRAGPLAPYWNYWTVMTLLTVPWVFGIPLLGPILLKWRDRARFTRTLWL